jgi:hypothetical protein
MLTDAGAPAVMMIVLLLFLQKQNLKHLAGAPSAVMLADTGAPAVFAPAPLTVMLAYAVAPAVLADAPLAVVLALPAPPLRCAHPQPLPPPFQPSTTPCFTASSACCPAALPSARSLRHCRSQGRALLDDRCNCFFRPRRPQSAAEGRLGLTVGTLHIHI